MRLLFTIKTTSLVTYITLVNNLWMIRDSYVTSDTVPRTESPYGTETVLLIIYFSLTNYTTYDTNLHTYRTILFLLNLK